MLPSRPSPGDFDVQIPTVPDSDVTAAIVAAHAAFGSWRSRSLDDRIALVLAAREALAERQAELARQMALEVGKPITEALAELRAVLAKFELAIGDARQCLSGHSEADAPHPNVVRRRPRGVAAVIGPFNFPVHLPHGAIVAHLLAGNTIVFKPSPLAAGVCQAYARLMIDALPPGVMQVVHGGPAVAAALAAHALVRNVHLTGSVSAGRAIARAVADDIDKSLALELGGKNAAIVLDDADPGLAASAVAEAMCLTTGQRCNSTSLVLVSPGVEASFTEHLREQLAAFVPGDPLLPSTRLGPLVGGAAVDRYVEATRMPGQWLVPGERVGKADGKQGHYVRPAVVVVEDEPAGRSLLRQEWFVPVLAMLNSIPADRMAAWLNALPFGLTTSIFTADRDRFMAFAAELDVGNVYHNLPTTFSPGQLPFGGLKQSGNGRPGGRGFVRFTTDEQVLQLRA